MRRTEMRDGARQVAEALDTSSLSKVLSEYLETLRKNLGISSKKDPSNFDGDLLQAFHSYSIRAQTFNTVAGQMVQIFDLTELENPTSWAGVIGGEPTEIYGRVNAIIKRVKFASEFLPKIVDLVQPTDLATINKAIKEKDPQFIKSDTFSIILLESEEHFFSNPKRIITALEGTQLLYEVSLELLNLPISDLGVVACDAGSDFSFDFFGVADAVEALKEIVLSMWDNIVFYRERQALVRIELVAQALPVIEQISSLEKEGGLGREQAEKLRRNLTEGVDKFISSGAIIPEVEQRTYYDPRTLLGPEPKLLTATSVAVEETVEQKDKDGEFDAVDLDNLSDEEKTQYLELLAKAKKTETKQQTNKYDDLLDLSDINDEDQDDD